MLELLAKNSENIGQAYKEWHFWTWCSCMLHCHYILWNWCRHLKFLAQLFGRTAVCSWQLWTLICVVQRWVQAFQTGVLNALVTTTNGLERQHEQLKYAHLSDVSNGSLTDVIKTVVKSYIPSCQQRFFILCVLYSSVQLIVQVTCLACSCGWVILPTLFVYFSKQFWGVSCRSKRIAVRRFWRIPAGDWTAYYLGKS